MKILKTDKKRTLTYIITVLLSLLYLFFGHMYTASGINVFSTDMGMMSCRAKVTKVTKTEEIKSDFMDGTGIEAESDKRIYFECKSLSRENKGETLKAVQLIDGYMANIAKPVSKGSTVYLYYSNDGDMAGNWIFSDYDRLGKIIILAFVFFAALIMFGRMQGFNTVVSLALTCAGVIWVFIPAVITCKNVYLWAILTCIYTIVMTLIIVYGINKKSVAAALGCFSGLITAGIITVIMDRVMRLSGYLSEDHYYLTRLGIDIRAVIFGAIIIGAMGAIMDISISISSALFEVREKAESIIPTDLIKSGFNIGRDILGTMSNTLILAYIGSSLSVILVLIIYSASPLELLNRERVIVELLQSLVGIIAILGTIPLTSVICGLFYGGKNENMYLLLNENDND